jgi:DNA-directed RNA polymerase specialized sigma24 family protein
MKIPDGLNEEEVVETIMSMAKRLAPKYVFAAYDKEDIEQEAFLIGIAGLEKYDSSRPLVNFMYTHMSNRLKTFKRDNYYRLDYGTTAEKIQDRKRRLLEPNDISHFYHIATSDTCLSEMQIQETLDLIDCKLPARLRKDYLKIKNNASITKERKSVVIDVIQKIINGEDISDV